MECMTSRERWLAALDFRPVDHLPFWPKIFPGYTMAQAAAYRDMSIPALHAWFGTDEHAYLPDWLRPVRKRTSLEIVDEGDRRSIRYSTPHGVLEGIDRFDAPSQSWHPVVFPVRTVEDVSLLTEFYADTRYEVDPERLEHVKATVQERGESLCSAGSIGESPLMYWLEYSAGVENGHFLLADHRADVEALFEAHHQVLLRRAELMAETCPVDVLYMIENTSTTLISPAQYRRYCYGHITAYGEIVRQAGRKLVLHMCGHLKALLPDLAMLPAVAFEAFTSPTLGNTTLLDGRTTCPDKCLVGGTNAILWTQPAHAIIAQIEADLAVCRTIVGWCSRRPG